MQEMNLAIQLLVEQNPLIGYWSNWMMIVMVSSLFFSWHHKSARVVLLSLPVLMFLAWLVFYQSSDVHLIGVSHLMLWPFLCYYLIKKEILRKGFQKKSLYGVWVILLVLTMLISLVFDIRDVALVIMGLK